MHSAAHAPEVSGRGVVVFGIGESSNLSGEPSLGKVVLTARTKCLGAAQGERSQQPFHWAEAKMCQPKFAKKHLREKNHARDEHAAA